LGICHNYNTINRRVEKVAGAKVCYYTTHTLISLSVVVYTVVLSSIPCGSPSLVTLQDVTTVYPLFLKGAALIGPIRVPYSQQLRD
jgi:hypothetical protein